MLINLNFFFVVSYRIKKLEQNNRDFNWADYLRNKFLFIPFFVVLVVVVNRIKNLWSYVYFIWYVKSTRKFSRNLYITRITSMSRIKYNSLVKGFYAHVIFLGFLMSNTEH